MTIIPKKDSFTVQCDSCRECLEVDSSRLKDLGRALRIKQWKTYKDKEDKWSHKCVACQEGKG